MELIYKYTIEDIESCDTIALVNSEEALTKEEFDNYTLGYDKFSNVTKVERSGFTDDRKQIYEFQPSGDGYNHILFLSSSDEIVGFSRLQSAINLTRYQITLLTIYLSFNFTEDYEEVAEVECTYDVHIARIAEVHKQLFKAGYQNKTTKISKINEIDKLDSIVVSSLYDFKVNNGRLIRYAGHYYLSETNGETITRIQRLVGYSLLVPAGYEVKSLYRNSNKIYGILFNETSLYNYCFDDRTSTRLEIRYSDQLTIFGSIIDTGSKIYDLKENVEFEYNTNYLRIIYDQVNSTIYTVGVDSKFICNRLYNLILSHGFSQSVARIHSISNSYILYQNGNSFTLVSHDARVNIGRNFKQLIPVTSKIYFAILSSDESDKIEEYKVYEVVFDDNNGEYTFNTIDLGYSYKHNNETKYYLKYIEVFAKNRYTNPFVNIQPFSFEGTLFTRDGNTLRTL